jgi:hypothetical protein
MSRLAYFSLVKISVITPAGNCLLTPFTDTVTAFGDNGNELKLQLKNTLGYFLATM